MVRLSSSAHRAAYVFASNVVAISLSFAPWTALDAITPAAKLTVELYKSSDLPYCFFSGRWAEMGTHRGWKIRSKNRSEQS